jgi:hypothetical protein
MLASSMVDHGFKPQSGQTKNDKIGISICDFIVKHDFDWYLMLYNFDLQVKTYTASSIRDTLTQQTDVPQGG